MNLEVKIVVIEIRETAVSFDGVRRVYKYSYDIPAFNYESGHVFQNDKNFTNSHGAGELAELRAACNRSVRNDIVTQVIDSVQHKISSGAMNEIINIYNSRQRVSPAEPSEPF